MLFWGFKKKRKRKEVNSLRWVWKFWYILLLVSSCFKVLGRYGNIEGLRVLIIWCMSDMIWREEE